MTDLLEVFNQVPKSGIYVLENPVDKKVYIGHSRNMITNISKIYEALCNGDFRLRDMVQDVNKLQFRVIEILEDELYRKLHINKWNDWYKENGWTLYEERSHLRFRIDYDVFPRLNLVQVVLVNARGERSVVGCFNTVEEAHVFIRENYNKEVNKYTTPVIACNLKTRDYFLTAKKSMFAAEVADTELEDVA